MRSLEASDVLALWERGAARHALDRSALLCSWARPELPAERIADLPLGEVTTTLLQLRAASFGALPTARFRSLLQGPRGGAPATRRRSTAALSGVGGAGSPLACLS